MKVVCLLPLVQILVVVAKISMRTCVIVDPKREGCLTFAMAFFTPDKPKRVRIDCNSPIEEDSHSFDFDFLILDPVMFHWVRRSIALPEWWLTCATLLRPARLLSFLQTKHILPILISVCLGGLTSP